MAWRPETEIREMFAEVGENILISTRAVFYEPEKMRFGDNARVDDFCLLSGTVTLGRNVHLTAFTHVAGGAPGVTFGDFSTCAYGCHILTQSDDYSGATMTNSTVPRRFKNETFSAVRIGRHAILGTGTIVLPGCDIGDGVSTGAGTVVTRPLAEWTVYVGQPARAVGPRSRQLLDLEAEYLEEER
jgi:acetyltransferase-like isoleucine patch superfamily enzyme